MNRTCFQGIVLGLVLVALAGCAGEHSTQEERQKRPEKAPERVSVDIGAVVEVNILIAKLKVWGVVHDADILIVQAYNWISRELRVMINGAPETIRLTEEQAAELSKENEKIK